MKNLVLAVVILIVGIAAVAEFRYDLVIDSPVVARLDRLTGDTWIVNAGAWRKVQPEPMIQHEASQAAQEEEKAPTE